MKPQRSTFIGLGLSGRIERVRPTSCRCFWRRCELTSMKAELPQNPRPPPGPGPGPGPPSPTWSRLLSVSVPGLELGSVVGRRHGDAKVPVQVQTVARRRLIGPATVKKRNRRPERCRGDPGEPGTPGCGSEGRWQLEERSPPPPSCIHIQALLVMPRLLPWGQRGRSCSYSRGGGAVVDQAVQRPQQVVPPGQVGEPLLHHVGEQLVLQILQRGDVLPWGGKEFAPMIPGGAS